MATDGPLAAVWAGPVRLGHCFTLTYPRRDGARTAYVINASERKPAGRYRFSPDHAQVFPFHAVAQRAALPGEQVTSLAVALRHHWQATRDDEE